MNKEYLNWIQSLKDRIRSAQLKASIAVNEQMILLYWDIGKDLYEKQQSQEWGSKVVENLAKDLKRELPDTNGFSRTNLFAMRRFYSFYKDSALANPLVHQLGERMQNDSSIVPQAVGQMKADYIIVHQPGGQLQKMKLTRIPWRHHVLIISKCSNVQEAEFYIKQTIKNNWSRSILELQIENKLIDRVGKSFNNFELTLPKLQSDLARETFKDPYKFDFLTLEVDIQELDLERKLTENITHFLLELGKGFAYVGRQYPLQIGSKERRLDLLFYHLVMRCYIVIDIKMTEFEPEFAGKMNYYLSAVDDLLKTELDQPTIGIILCRTKSSLDVEYALRDINKPMGISGFSFKELPINIQRNLPTVEELEDELKKYDLN